MQSHATKQRSADMTQRHARQGEQPTAVAGPQQGRLTQLAAQLDARPENRALAALAAGLSRPVQRQPNRTGLPDALKQGMEDRSGLPLDDVRVHYNSAEPARFQAHAITQGKNIHVAPGQQQHLPHELGHVVQQMQGRVRPTMQMQGVPVNDDPALEAEADRLGAQVSQGLAPQQLSRESEAIHPPVQRAKKDKKKTKAARSTRPKAKATAKGAASGTKVRMMSWNALGDKSPEDWADILTRARQQGVNLITLMEAPGNLMALKAGRDLAKWKGAKVHGPYPELTPTSARTTDEGNAPPSAGFNKFYAIVAGPGITVEEKIKNKKLASEQKDNEKKFNNKFIKSQFGILSFIEGTKDYNNRKAHERAEEQRHDAERPDGVRRSKRKASPSTNSDNFKDLGLKMPFGVSVAVESARKKTRFDLTMHHADEGGGKQLALPSNLMALVRKGGRVPERTVMTGDMNLNSQVASSTYKGLGKAPYFVSGKASGGDEWTHTAGTVELRNAVKDNPNLSGLARYLGPSGSKKFSDHFPSFVDIIP
ncbi:MAG TPA: DUF4157 domain-containing protein [Azospirillaceae bacterium]|nr:DUF4157 domain-containing protein [Azospirillaceae bacterium]